MFIAPENQPEEQPKKAGFIAPENQEQNAQPLAQDKPTPSLVDNLMAKMPVSLSPIEIQTQPLQQGSATPMPVKNVMPPTLQEEIEAAHLRGEQHPSENAATYEASENYPPQGMTTLGPSIDAAFVASLGKDVAGAAAKGIVKGVQNVAKKQSEKKALKDFIKAPKPVEGTPTTPIELRSVPKSAVGPDVGQLQKSSPDVEVFVKGVQKGLPAKGIPDIPIYGVKGDPKTLEKLFGDAAPGSVTVDQLKKANIPLPGEAPKIAEKVAPMQLEFPTPAPKKGIEFNTKQTREIEKVLGKPLEAKEKVLDDALGIPTQPIKPITETDKLIQRAARDEMREPIVPPSPKTVPTRLPGSKERVKQFESLVESDIDPRNPLTSRAELNKKLGYAEETASKQWIEGVKAENKAIENSIKDKTSLYATTKIRPETLESEALFTYIESPNKLEAYGRIAQAAGKEKADEILKAADNMRATYDKLFKEVNEVRKANGLKPIQYRENYITHANEMNILNDLGKLDLIDTPEGQALALKVLKAGDDIARDTPNLYAKLKDVIFPYTVRKGGETSLDAVANFNRYVDTAHRYIQTQPYVNELYDTAKAIKGKSPNLAAYLENQANFIAGGKNQIDKGIEAVVDKDLLRIAQQLQNNAKGNVISMNPSVPITQLFGLVPTAGKFPLKQSLSAAINSFINPEFEKFAIANSPILQTRALGAAENDLMLGPIARQSARVTNWFDYKVAEISWMAAFKDSISKGKPLAEAIQAGNDWAALSQAHLGRVSTPPMMQSKNVQAVLPLMNQQIAYARSLLLHTLQGKTLTEKNLAAIKMLILGTAIAAIKESITGTPDHPLAPTSVLPFGGVLEHGAGGPLLNQTARLATAKSQDDFVRQLIRTGFLLQSKIPGGATVGRIVENVFLGKKKKK